MSGYEPGAQRVMADALLEQIVTTAHPLLAEAILLAALPLSYDAALLAALRQRGDRRDERLTARLAQFSFVEELPGTRYMVSPTDRPWFHARWQRQDPDGYRAAHRRALAHLSSSPLPDPFSQDQALLFHELLSVPEQGVRRYVETSRLYIANQQLAAMERLIATAREAQGYLEQGGNVPPELSPLSAYLDARLLQLRGQWADSLAPLEALGADGQLPASIRPFVQRALGLAVAQRGQYMDAVRYYRRALAGFTASADRGETMIQIGDAYRDLAVAATGEPLFLPKPTSGWARVKATLAAIPALPVLLYLALQGFNLFSRALWASQSGQDWLLARLFGLAARAYRQAAARAVPLADERLADLMLTVGDASGAIRRLTALRDDPARPLGPYRLAAATLGMAKAHLRQGNDAIARAELERALPTLAAYQDAASVAESELLLGDIALRSSEAAPPETLGHFERAMAYYRAQDDRLALTEIAEHLEGAAADASNAPLREPLGALAAQVTERSYRVRFRHSLALLFQRLSLAFIALVLFAIPMVTLDPQPPSLLEMTVNVGWNPQAAANPLNLAVEPVVQATAPPTLQMQAGLGTTLWLVGAYLAAQLLLGLMLILFTQSREIEREVQREQIHLDLDRIRAKEDHPGLPWAQIREGLGADMRLGDALLRDNSGLLLKGEAGATAWIPGQTSHYDDLRKRLAGRWPQREIGYSLLFSPMGVLYLLGLLLLISTILLNHLDPVLTNRPLLGSYSLALLYPLFFLLLMVPTLWWAALRPMRMYRQLDRLSPLIWWVAANGILLALIRLAMPHRNWFVYPDIYPSLIALGLLGSALLGLWQSRHAPEGNLPSWRDLLGTPRPLRIPRWLRAGLILLMLLLVVPTAARLGRDLIAYHHWVKGHAAFSRAIAQPDSADEYRIAEQQYQAAIRRDPRHRLALQGLAAVQTSQERYDEALATFDRALAAAPNRQTQAFLLADRAVLFARLSLAATDSGQAASFRNRAEQDAARAVQWNPIPAFEQKLGQLWIVQGWTAYQNGAYDRALRLFDNALAASAPAADVALGRAYALYKLDRFEEARAAFSQGIAARPDQALPYAARAVATWQIARREEPGLCEDGDATPQTIRRIEAGLADIERSIALQPQPFSYRTAAQFHYLLRRCPGYDLERELEAAIEGYQEAIRLDPTEPYYWELLARLRYALSLERPTPEARAVQWRGEAVAAIEEAARVAALPTLEGEEKIGVTGGFDGWRAELLAAHGDDLFRSGSYAEARNLYAQAVRFDPTLSYRFKLARAAVMVGEPASAAAAYHDGLRDAPYDPELIESSVGYLGRALATAPDAESRLGALAAALGSDLARITEAPIAFWRGRAQLCIALAELPQAGSARPALWIEAAASNEGLATAEGVLPEEARAARIRAALLRFRAGQDSEALQALQDALAGVPTDDPVRGQALALLDALLAADPSLAARAEPIRAAIAGE